MYMVPGDLALRERSLTGDGTSFISLRQNISIYIHEANVQQNYVECDRQQVQIITKRYVKLMAHMKRKLALWYATECVLMKMTQETMYTQRPTERRFVGQCKVNIYVQAQRLAVVYDSLGQNGARDVTGEEAGW